MNIEELLYHLQHPETLDQLTLHEINQLMIKYPYLESLKLLYEKKLGIQSNGGWNALNLEQRLELVSHQAYQAGGEYVFIPPVFDLPIRTEALEEKGEAIASAPDAGIPVEIPVSRESKFQLYPYEESEFIQFLNSLRPTLSAESGIIPLAVQVSELEVQETEKLITTSLDLQPNFGTERLADLWVAQGKFLEAIAIYEKLSFEYPDKTAIFAAKIEKLKAENSI
jgi:hypothetical protein